MWWNFIGRTHKEIVTAREARQAQSDRFGRVEGYAGDRLPAPELPDAALTPRRNPARPVRRRPARGGAQAWSRTGALSPWPYRSAGPGAPAGSGLFPRVRAAVAPLDHRRSPAPVVVDVLQTGRPQELDDVQQPVRHADELALDADAAAAVAAGRIDHDGLR
jgi:hypothetical protein